MRKFVILGIAVVLGGAALLIPAGGGAALPTGNTKFNAQVTSPISVECEAGADLGEATFTVRANSHNQGSASTGSGADRILVTWSTGSAIITDLDTDVTLTDDDFPCPETSTTSSSVSFTFQPQDSTANGYVNQGTSTTATATTDRTGSAS